jgi:hypothetical protein
MLADDTNDKDTVCGVWDSLCVLFPTLKLF